MSKPDVEEVISPRVLIAKKSQYPNDRNEYRSKNYTDSTTKYKTDNGQITGEFIIGYAEVEKGTVLRSYGDLETFKDQVDQLAEDVIWKTDMVQRMKIQDALYSEYDSKKYTDIDKLVDEVTKDVGVGDVGDNIHRELRTKVKEEAEKVFTEHDKLGDNR